MTTMIPSIGALEAVRGDAKHIVTNYFETFGNFSPMWTNRLISFKVSIVVILVFNHGTLTRSV